MKKKIFSKKDIEKLEQRGYWEASSSLSKLVKRLVRKNKPLEIEYIKNAHKKIFEILGQAQIAGKYRQENGPELKRIDGSVLKMTDWREIPNAMAELNQEVKESTKSLSKPKTEKDYERIVFIAAKLSHRLTVIHPFKNGNGRASRLLLNAILLRAELSEITIKKSKSKYLRALCQADDGNYSLLEDIIVDGLLELKQKKYETLKKKES